MKATSPIGLRVAGEGLRLPSLRDSQGILKFTGMCVFSICISKIASEQVHMWDQQEHKLLQTKLTTTEKKKNHAL